MEIIAAITELVGCCDLSGWVGQMVDADWLLPNGSYFLLTAADFFLNTYWAAISYWQLLYSSKCNKFYCTLHHCLVCSYMDFHSASYWPGVHSTGFSIAERIGVLNNFV